VLWGIHVIMLLVEERQNNPAANWEDVVVSIAVPLVVFLFLALTYISLRVSEAFLRVAPACIRYWIETTEERRLSGRVK
jgi:small neutral amino acid transporter SnatA (MarC family)